MVNSPARQLGQVAAPRLLPSGSARLQLTLPWTDGQVTLAQRVLGWHFGWHMHLTYSDIPTNLHQSPSNPLSKEGFSYHLAFPTLLRLPSVSLPRRWLLAQISAAAPSSSSAARPSVHCCGFWNYHQVIASGLLYILLFYVILKHC